MIESWAQTETRLLLVAEHRMKDVGSQAVQRWLMESAKVT